MRCPFCNEVVHIRRWVSHTTQCSNLTYHSCCNCWGNQHECVTYEEHGKRYCRGCFEQVEFEAPHTSRTCTNYCRYCGEDLSGDEWEHWCSKEYYSRKAMENQVPDDEDMEEINSNNFVVHVDRVQDPSNQWIDECLRDIHFIPQGTYVSVDTYMRDLGPYLYEETRRLHQGKYTVCVTVSFERPVVNEDITMELDREVTFSRDCRPMGEWLDFEWIFQKIKSWLITQIEAYTKLSSGWRVRTIDSLVLSVAHIPGLKGGCSSRKIPKYLKKKTTQWVRVLDYEKHETACFKDAVLMGLALQDDNVYIKQKIKNIRKAKYFRALDLNSLYNLDFSDMDEYGMFNTEKLHLFEQKNNITVRCYAHSLRDDNQGFMGPIMVNERAHNPEMKVVHLLFVCEFDADNLNSLEGHYLCVTNFQAMASHYSSYKRSYKTHGRTCEYCFIHFPKTTKNADFEAHVKHCNNMGNQYGEMTRKHTLKFEDHSKMTQPINVVYADTESMIVPDAKGDRHVCAFIGYLLQWHEVLQGLNTNTVHVTRGEHCVKDFLDDITEMVKENLKILDETRKKMDLTPEDKEHIANTKQCELCKIPECDTRGGLHRDHDHLTGKFLQMLCSKCNMKRRQSRHTLYVVLHNAKNYDMHTMMMDGICKLKSSIWIIEPVYQSGDKLICLTLKYKPIEIGAYELKDGRRIPIHYRVIFRDSCQFLPKSLASLAILLPTTPITSGVMHKTYGVTADRFGKGIYPYSYFSEWNRLKETRLPDIQYFYNDLEEKECDLKDYEEARHVWDITKCKTLEDYTIVYLFKDVALLADIMQAFRKQVFEMARLEPFHFCGLPGLTYSFAFKHSNLNLDPMQDSQMYMFFEEGIRGGMTAVNRHVSKAETASAENNYQHTHLFDVDANALYTGALSAKLPQRDFKWMETHELKEIDDVFMKQWDSEGDAGMTLMVDLEYPPDIQDQTMDLPYAPTSSAPLLEDMTLYMHDLWKEIHGDKPRHPGVKLLLTHKNKERYIVHHSILKYYVTHGMRITKVHMGVKYHQEAFFKSYAELHTTARSKATNELEKMIRKLYMNALYGKTMENPRKYGIHKFVRNIQEFKRYIMHPLCKKWFKISEHAIVIELINKKVILDKPIYIGQAVLERSKKTMYEMFVHWKQNPKILALLLIGGDTDSFFLEVKSRYDRNAILREFRYLKNEIDPEAEGVLDTSNYPKDHPLYSTKNTSRLGCFKDESKGRSIKEFICLCPKQYSFILEDGEHDNRAKGVKHYKRKTLTHEDYRAVFENHEHKQVTQNFLQSHHHVMRTIKQTRQALTPLEDKRCWLSENVSVPYGHHRLYSESILSFIDQYGQDCQQNGRHARNAPDISYFVV